MEARAIQSSKKNYAINVDAEVDEREARAYNTMRILSNILFS